MENPEERQGGRTVGARGVKSPMRKLTKINKPRLIKAHRDSTANQEAYMVLTYMLCGTPNRGRPFLPIGLPWLALAEEKVSSLTATCYTIVD